MRVPSTALLEEWSKQGGRLPQICTECLRLRQILRSLHEDASTTEDAGSFVMGIIENFPAEIESWGETAFESEHARAAREAAEEKREELAELNRLISKYLPPEVMALLSKYGLRTVYGEQDDDGNQ